MSAAPLPNRSDYDPGVNVGAGVMSMTSGRSYLPPNIEDALAAARFTGRLYSLEQDREKAGRRHAQHQQLARKAVSGLRAVFGPAVASSVETHVTALVADVAKHADIAAGLQARALELARELGTTSEALRRSRTRAGELLGAIRSSCPGLPPLTAGDVDSNLEQALHMVLAQVGSLEFRARVVDEVLAQLVHRPTNAELHAARLQVDHLEGRIREAVRTRKLPASTGNLWIRKAAQLAEAHVDDRAGSFAQRWAAEWERRSNEPEREGTTWVDRVVDVQQRVLDETSIAAEAAAAPEQG